MAATGGARRPAILAGLCRALARGRVLRPRFGRPARGHPGPALPALRLGPPKASLGRAGQPAEPSGRPAGPPAEPEDLQIFTRTPGRKRKAQIQTARASMPGPEAVAYARGVRAATLRRRTCPRASMPGGSPCPPTTPARHPRRAGSLFRAPHLASRYAVRHPWRPASPPGLCRFACGGMQTGRPRGRARPRGPRSLRSFRNEAREVPGGSADGGGHPWPPLPGAAAAFHGRRTRYLPPANPPSMAGSPAGRPPRPPAGFPEAVGFSTPHHRRPRLFRPANACLRFSNGSPPPRTPSGAWLGVALGGQDPDAICFSGGAWDGTDGDAKSSQRASTAAAARTLRPAAVGTRASAGLRPSSVPRDPPPALGFGAGGRRRQRPGTPARGPSQGTDPAGRRTHTPATHPAGRPSMAAPRGACAAVPGRRRLSPPCGFSACVAVRPVPSFPTSGGVRVLSTQG